MSGAPARRGMAPPHPGAFIRDEILDELVLSVSEAAKVLDGHRQLGGPCRACANRSG